MAADWTGGAPPGSGDRGTVNDGRTVSITSDVGTINALRVGSAGNGMDGSGTLVIDGATGGRLAVSDIGGAGTGADVVIGSGAFMGTLRLMDGGILTSNNSGGDGEVFIGQGNGSEGFLLLDGGTLNANRGFYVADGGGSSGEARVGDGLGGGDAVLNTQGGNLDVGNDGDGTLIVAVDGRVNVNSNNLVIGQTPGSNGHVIVDGGVISFASNTTGDINMNSGTSQLTLNAGSIEDVDAFNQSALEGTPSIVNLNGGLLALAGNFVDRNGLSTINYNGTQVEVGGGALSTTFLNVGTDSAPSGAVTMNLVGPGLAVAAGDVAATTTTVYRGLTLGSAGVDATVNVNHGELTVVRGIRGGGGVSTLNVGTQGSAGQLNLEGVNSGVKVGGMIDVFRVGEDGTLEVRPNAFGLNPVQTAAADLTGATLVVDNRFVMSAANGSPLVETIWVAGEADWVAGDELWSRGSPTGYAVAAGTQMTVLESVTPVVGAVNLVTAGWTLEDDGTVSGVVTVSNDAALQSGPTRAVLRGTPTEDAVVTRLTDLIVSNSVVAGAVGAPDAAHLEIMDNATLTVGTPTANADVYVGGDANGGVDQNGDMTIYGNLFFGQDAGGGDNGGTWNLGGGETLTVTGRIEERAASTNSAQFYIRGGTLDVAGDLTVQRLDLAMGNGQASTLDVKPGQTVTTTGTMQIGQNSRGQVNVTEATSVLQAANMTIGAGNANDSTLNVTAGIGGTNGGSLTLGTNAGPQSGPQLLVSGSGIARVTNGDITQAAGGVADLAVNSGATVEVRVTETGLLDIGRHFNLHNNATAGHGLTVVVNEQGTVRVGTDVVFRAGDSTLRVEGGTMDIGRDVWMGAGTGSLTVSGTLGQPATLMVGRDLVMNGTGTQVLSVEGTHNTVSVANNIVHEAGRTIRFAPSAAGVSAIEIGGAVGLPTLNGTVEVDLALLNDPAYAVEAVTRWNTGSGGWTTLDAEWQTDMGRAVNPDGLGVLETGDRLTAFTAPNGSFLLGSPTVTTPDSAPAADPDWRFEISATGDLGELIYEGGAVVDSLPLHAVLETASNGGGDLTILRETDLMVAPVAGHDAAALTVMDGVTLNLSEAALDPNLVLGSAGEFGQVTQTGGAVNVDGDLVFGTGAGSRGGNYDLRGGTLRVGGSIVEGGTAGVEVSVDGAQLNIDGGTLELVGTAMDVESLRVGHAVGAVGAVTLADKNLRVSGAMRVGEAGEGTMTLVGTTTATVVEAVLVGDALTGDGTLVVGSGGDAPAVTVDGIEVGVAGMGTLTLLSGTLTSTGGIDLASVAGGVGAMVVGDGTSSPVIHNSGGNFETGDQGTGVVTWNSGTLNQTSNNLIVGQGVDSDATFVLNDGLIDVENLLRMNNGTGRVDQRGGVMNIGATMDMVNAGTDGISSTYEISGGILNVGDRAAGDMVIGNAANGTSAASVVQTGGTVNVDRHVYAGGASAGRLSLSGVSSVLNVGYDHAGGSVDDGSARLFVGNNNAGVNVTALTSGSVNVGGGIWVGTNAGASGEVRIGSTGGADDDTTIRVGVAGVDGLAETRVGNNGEGRFVLESGRYYQEAGNFVVATGEASSGTAVISGGALHIGFEQPGGTSNGLSDLAFGSGVGEMRVTGGEVHIARNLQMATTSTGDHLLRIEGGTVNVGGHVQYGLLGDDDVVLEGGVLNFTTAGGGTINVSNARDEFIFSGGTLQNLGRFDGYDPSAFPEVANLGTNPSDALLLNGVEGAFAAGKVGNGLTFDAALNNDEAVSFADARLGNPEALSLSVWFNRLQDNSGTASDTNHNVNNVIVGQSSASANDNFEIGTEGSRVELYFDTNGAGPAGDFLEIDVSGIGSGIVNGEWHHLVLTYDGSAASDRLNVYFDGQEVTTIGGDEFTGVLQSAATSPLSLGIARPGDNNWGDFTGQLDEFATWTTAIGPAEVADLYNGGSGSNTAAILGSAVIYAPLEQPLEGNLTTLVQTGGVMAPGLAGGGIVDQLGVSTIDANYDLSGGSGMWEIDLVSDTIHGVLGDRIDVTGELTLGGGSALDLVLLSWDNLTAADVFVIGSYDRLVGNFSLVDFSELIAQSGVSEWQLDYNYQGLNQIAVLAPEPSRGVLLLVGLLCGVWRRQRRLG